MVTVIELFFKKKNKSWRIEARRRKKTAECIQIKYKKKSRGRYESKEQKNALEIIKFLY